MVRPAIHSFPHRGSPSTSHTRVRWQPYHTSLQTIPPRSSPLAYFVTPASSTSSISPSPRSFAEPERHAPHPPRESKLRDIQKSRFALSLVDQAVKCLCDIWPQQDIPTVFLTSNRPMVSPVSDSGHHHVAHKPQPMFRNAHLPSPISPTTQPTPSTSPDPPCPVQPVQRRHRCETAPMKGFVHEVLRRSRTSGTVLQTALCYLEAIRSKVPDLIRKEKRGDLSPSPVASDIDRICQGEVVIEPQTDLGSPASNSGVSSTDNMLATVRINLVSRKADPSSIEPDLDVTKVPAHEPTQDNVLPPLPSPLLCPRRTFLASLILASKFMQDRCYSNRAWAKLSGLPPREIGRCERALGEALEWRLWVGKLPAAQSASGRPLSKCKSESDINISGNPSMTYMACDVDLSSLPDGKGSSLRRSATLPPGSLCPESSRVPGTDNPNSIAYTSPSTPGLSYSPTPTESSLGDRTVQMSSFMDVSTPPPGQFATFTGVQNDKVLAMLSVPPHGLYVYGGFQDALHPLSHSNDPQYLTHGSLAPNCVWLYHEDA